MPRTRDSTKPWDMLKVSMPPTEVGWAVPGVAILRERDGEGGGGSRVGESLGSQRSISCGGLEGFSFREKGEASGEASGEAAGEAAVRVKW